MYFLGSILFSSPGHPTPGGCAQNQETAEDRALLLLPTLRELKLTWCVIPVQDTESQEGTIAVGCKRGFCQGCQVVHVVECWTLMLIIASQEEVDMIWGLQRKDTSK